MLTLRGFAGRTTVSVINEAVAGHTVNQVTLGALDVSFVPQGPEPVRGTTPSRKAYFWQHSWAAVCRGADEQIHVMCREACSSVCHLVSLQFGALAPQLALLTCGAPAMWDTSLQAELCPSLSSKAG